MDLTRPGDVIQSLHSLVPILTALCFISSHITSIFRLQPAKTTLIHHTKTTVLCLFGVVILLYLTEAVLIVGQIFAHVGRLASRDCNIFVLGQAIIWLTCCAALTGSDLPQWYPYLGPSIISLSGELIIMTLSIRLISPGDTKECVQVLLMALRVLVLSFLITTYLVRGRDSTAVEDEETTPLLPQDQNKNTKPQARTFGFGSVNNDEAAITAAAEDEVAKRKRKEEEKVEKLRSRIQEEGGWYRYVCGYSIFAPYIWPSKRPWLMLNMAGTMLCVLATRALNILTPRQLGVVVNFLGVSQPKAFAALGIYLALVWASSYSGIRALQTMMWIPVTSNAQISMQCASYDHIMELSCDFHDEKQSGELYTAMGQGDQLIHLLDLLLVDCMPILIDLSLSLAYFYILFDTYLVLIGAATIVLYLWAFIALMDVGMKIHRQKVVAGRKQMSVMYDTMGEWRTVSYFNRIPFTKQIYSSSVALTQRLRNQLVCLWQVGSGMTEITLQLGGAAAFLFAAYQVVYGGKSVGSFVTLTGYWWTFTDPIHQFARIHRDILSDLVKAEELLSLFRTKPTIQDGPNELQVTEGKVVFGAASFHYAGKDTFINELSFTANPGKTIALIGETGAGKSTILKLLFRFYDVTQGSISIDGQDIRNVTVHSLREHIGVVPQDASLFNDTVLANVRFARLDATEDEVTEACKAAAIHDRVMTFPEGYHTKVGEKGQKLSGGELQRIAIARAILKDPKIILLDEATSSVDNETESKIQEGLNRLCKGRTTFVVAHRLSTVMDADTILVIGDGKIAEQGAPKELLKKKGKYYKLWSKQLGIMDVMEKAERAGMAEETSTQAGTSSQSESITDGDYEYDDDKEDYDDGEDSDGSGGEELTPPSQLNDTASMPAMGTTQARDTEVNQNHQTDNSTLKPKPQPAASGILERLKQFGSPVQKGLRSENSPSLPAPSLTASQRPVSTKTQPAPGTEPQPSNQDSAGAAGAGRFRAGNARRKRQRAHRKQAESGNAKASASQEPTDSGLDRDEPPGPAPTPAAGVPVDNAASLPEDLSSLKTDH